MPPAQTSLSSDERLARCRSSARGAGQPSADHRRSTDTLGDPALQRDDASQPDGQMTGRTKEHQVPLERSLVRLRPSLETRERKALPFKEGVAYLFLGEIRNMPGHCVVADLKTGRLWTGYHTDTFVEIPKDEV